MSGFDISMYRDMFMEEAGELFESADNVLLVAEKNGSLTDDEMGQLFRDVHTLKGSGASVELTYFAEFTHDVENLMDKLRNHKIEFIPEMAGALMDGLDVMKEILQLENNGQMDRDTFESMSHDLLIIIRAYINGETVGTKSKQETPQTVATQSVSAIDIKSQNQKSEQKSTSYGFFGEDVMDDLIDSDDFGFFDSALDITPESVIELNTPRASAPELIQEQAVVKPIQKPVDSATIEKN